MLSQRRAGQLQARNGNCRDIFPTPFSASCHSGIVSSPPTSVVFVYAGGLVQRDVKRKRRVMRKVRKVSKELARMKSWLGQVARLRSFYCD
ncbi:hypothetical protein V1477_000955 [Vespula maculifrons]|uniref:Uncharacterized protein n=2 Tax=Vespula TaxID=7451 RepID=A0A834J9Q9_VESVU|nr:hypothetical protein HZH66_012513 [Vespula vulgaris]